jgi:hypothetical protein
VPENGVLVQWDFQAGATFREQDLWGLIPARKQTVARLRHVNQFRSRTTIGYLGASAEVTPLRTQEQSENNQLGKDFLNRHGCPIETHSFG